MIFVGKQKAKTVSQKISTPVLSQLNKKPSQYDLVQALSKSHWAVWIRGLFAKRLQTIQAYWRNIVKILIRAGFRGKNE